MSHDKSWKLRTILSSGAAALVLSLAGTPSLAGGAGHEGHMAGMRGGGGGAGEVRSTSERFNSIRVETLSPTAFTSRSMPDVTTAHQMPSATGPRRSPEPPVMPPTTPGAPNVTTAHQIPSANGP